MVLGLSRALLPCSCVELIEVFQQRIAIAMHENLTGSDVSVHLAFTLLPTLGPEPSLIGWIRHLVIVAHT